MPYVGLWPIASVRAVKRYVRSRVRSGSASQSTCGDAASFVAGEQISRSALRFVLVLKVG